jgi:hypothetical protein
MTDDHEPSEQESDPKRQLNERDRRDLDAMQSGGGGSSSLPAGCIISVIILVLVFFLILGICRRG